jgi:hypothetical protein
MLRVPPDPVPKRRAVSTIAWTTTVLWLMPR